MRILILLLLGLLSFQFSFAQDTAPQQGGSTDGPTAIDTVVGPIKGGEAHLSWDRSSCLSTRISHQTTSLDPGFITVTSGYEGGSVWMDNKCSVKIEFQRRSSV